MITRVQMRTGTIHMVRGYAGEIAKKIEDGVEGDMALIPLEKDTIPTGQMFYINPAEVESVKDET